MIPSSHRSADRIFFLVLLAFQVRFGPTEFGCNITFQMLNGVGRWDRNNGNWETACFRDATASSSQDKAPTQCHEQLPTNLFFFGGESRWFKKRYFEEMTLGGGQLLYYPRPCYFVRDSGGNLLPALQTAPTLPQPGVLHPECHRLFRFSFQLPWAWNRYEKSAF